jgi:methyl-accepting chemotaxis protein
MMGFNTKLIVGVFLVFLLILINGTLMYRGTESLTSTEKLINHTWQLISQGERLGKTLVEIEARGRGYLIVGTEKFLAP